MLTICRGEAESKRNALPQPSTTRGSKCNTILCTAMAFRPCLSFCSRSRLNASNLDSLYRPYRSAYHIYMIMHIYVSIVSIYLSISLSTYLYMYIYIYIDIIIPLYPIATDPHIAIPCPLYIYRVCIYIYIYYIKQYGNAVFPMISPYKCCTDACSASLWQLGGSGKNTGSTRAFGKVQTTHAGANMQSM